MKVFAFVLLFLAGLAGLRFLLGRARTGRRSGAQAMAAQLGLQVIYFDILGKAVAAPSPAGGHWEVAGRWNGRDVRIDGLPGVRYSMAVRAPFRAPRALGLSISPTTAAHKFHPSGARRVLSGNAEFDNAVEVRGRDAARVEAFARRPAVQRAWLDAVAADGSTCADDASVFVVRSVDSLADGAVARAALDAVTRAADAIEGAMGAD